MLRSCLGNEHCEYSPVRWQLLTYKQTSQPRLEDNCCGFGTHPQASRALQKRYSHRPRVRHFYPHRSDAKRRPRRRTPLVCRNIPRAGAKWANRPASRDSKGRPPLDTLQIWPKRKRTQNRSRRFRKTPPTLQCVTSRLADTHSPNP